MFVGEVVYVYVCWGRAGLREQLRRVEFLMRWYVGRSYRLYAWSLHSHTHQDTTHKAHTHKSHTTLSAHSAHPTVSTHLALRLGVADHHLVHLRLRTQRIEDALRGINQRIQIRLDTCIRRVEGRREEGKKGRREEERNMTGCIRKMPYHVHTHTTGQQTHLYLCSPRSFKNAHTYTHTHTPTHYSTGSRLSSSHPSRPSPSDRSASATKSRGSGRR